MLHKDSLQRLQHMLDAAEELIPHLRGLLSTER